MNDSGQDRIWTRGWRAFREEGLPGLVLRVRQRLGWSALKLWLRLHDPGGPSRILASRSRPMAPDQVRRIAVLRLWGLGDLILATPALQMLKSRFPSARMTLVGPPSIIKVLEGVPLFEDYVAIPPSALNFRHGPPLGMFKALSRLQRLRPDLLIVSYPLNYGWIGSLLNHLGARWVVAPEKDAGPRQATVRVPSPPERHVVLINAALAQAAGCHGPAPPLQVWLNQAERSAAAAWVQKHAPQRPRVAFNVGSTPGLWQKRWPAEYFVELGNRLAANWSARVVLLKGPDEVQIVEKVASDLRQPPAVAGPELSLREKMAVLEQMDGLVAPLSVWMHVATAVGTPAVALIGIDPVSYDPWGDPAIHRVIVSPAPCARCWKHQVPIPCPDAHCMREITVDRVEAEVNELWTRTLKSRGGGGGQP